MMSGAASDAKAESKRPREDATPEAPYGYKADGTPRRSNGGRPRRSPSVDELKERRQPTPGADDDGSGTEDQAPAFSVPEDRPPDSSNRSWKSKKQGKKTQEPLPPWSEGKIAKGMNKMYRRAGKIVRVWDAEIGQAIIEATKKEDEEDVTVGEAWEEVARTNPRIRRFLLKMIAGGAWGQLFMAHAPILLAIFLKDSVQRMIPFGSLIASMAEPDEDTPPGEGGLPGGMTAADVQEASRLAQEQMAKMGMAVPPGMARMAEQMFVPNGGTPTNGGPVPPAFQRNQPRHKSRAQRAGHR